MADYSRWDLVLEGEESEIDLPPVYYLSNQYWTKCVYMIQKRAATLQYQFACLSTLGGAHFLVSQDRFLSSGFYNISLILLTVLYLELDWQVSRAL